MAWVTPGYNGGYPYPYPQDPYPTSTGTGYHGYGSGVKGQKPVQDTMQQSTKNTSNIYTTMSQSLLSTCWHRNWGDVGVPLSKSR